MEKDISKCIETYKQFVNQEDIQLAYFSLLKYMAEIKTKFPNPYTTGNISPGYLDYTYFPFVNDYLRGRKLRFGVVLNHKKMRFELWLMGQNIAVQKGYWEILKDTSWNKKIAKMPKYSVLEIVLFEEINFKNKDFMTESIINKAIKLAIEIEKFLISNNL